MSLQNFNSDEPTDTHLSSDKTSKGDSWYIRPDKYIDSGDTFFSDDSPNRRAAMRVPNRLAVDLKLIEDEDRVKSIAEWWDDSNPSQYNQVIKVVFNDFSTWHIPLRPWNKDYANIRGYVVERYLPEIIEFKAIINEEDPEQRVEEWIEQIEESEPKWFADVEDTEITEEQRKYFNKNADWLPHIDRTVGSSSEDVDLDLDDESWTDDW